MFAIGRIIRLLLTLAFAAAAATVVLLGFIIAEAERIYREHAAEHDELRPLLQISLTGLGISIVMSTMLAILPLGDWPWLWSVGLSFFAWFGFIEVADRAAAIRGWRRQPHGR